jgi:hypothetical protein
MIHLAVVAIDRGAPLSRGEVQEMSGAPLLIQKPTFHLAPVHDSCAMTYITDITDILIHDIK